MGEQARSGIAGLVVPIVASHVSCTLPTVQSIMYERCYHPAKVIVGNRSAS